MFPSDVVVHCECVHCGKFYPKTRGFLCVVFRYPVRFVTL